MSTRQLSVLGFGFTGLLMVGFCSPGFASTSVSEIKLAPLPAWAQDSLYGNGIFFDIDALMQKESLTRFEAVELQNNVKDILDGDSNHDLQNAFDLALQSIKSKKFESHWSPVTFSKSSEYVAVLDMDETLLMQWYASGVNGFFDLNGLQPDFVGKLLSPSYVKFTPNAENFIKGLGADSSCKGIVIFSAKADAPAIDIVRNWKFADGAKVGPRLSAVFTRNHLVLAKKTLVPSKDLRIFDEKLQHVVMVDDNPARVMQLQALKAQPKFDADNYHKAIGSGDEKTKNHYESILSQTLSEIGESAKSAEILHIPFTQSFLPYSYSGERITRALTSSLKSAKNARDFTRLHPELQEAAFVPAP